MKKHYGSVPKKNYRKLNDSLSDTEIDARRSSCEQLDKSLVDEFSLKCSMGDGSVKNRARKSTSPSKESTSQSPTRSTKTKGRSSKAFTQMKIKDEVKIDLRQYESSDNGSVRSTCKIYPIEEVSENVSRASSKMRIDQFKKRQEVQRIMEDNKNRAKCRPTGNATNKYPSMMQLHDEIEIFRPAFYQSSQSLVASAFEDHLVRSPSSSPSKSEVRSEYLYDRFGSLASFKRAQIHKLSNDSLAYQERRERHIKKFDDSYHELMTIRSYPSSDSRPTSCFGCFVKPFAKMCKGKSRKF